MENRIAVYPGNFDPVTNGHIDIIERAARIFPKVVVAVAASREKRSLLFSLEERVSFLKDLYQEHTCVEITSFNGLLIDFMKQHNAQVIIRGLRAVSDFEMEFQFALMNQQLAGDIETLFMMSRSTYSYLSSSAVKQVIRFKGNVSNLVPACVENALWAKFHG